ncbi:uncharacterized protein LOC105160897 isoform X2 [Sesamum indicum]|uniref:Uncharacterized protein LOC105160897 isoform X2 n=1 Tax=Sesamum indicum TaxID=4182 RepID=A0A6I9T862_SESIN|nr:uncharacterized protein LOC105160897 isoform X2 [Sesamum indicum]
MPRSRARKARLTRMDAAVDAMVPFGFPEEKVRKHVKELLKEYGGDEGWPFIEEYSYKELIDAILRDDEENDQEKVAEDGHRGKDKSSGDEIAAGTSSSAPDSQQDERPQETTPADIAGSSCAVAESTLPEISSSSLGINAGWKDILPYQQSEHVASTANISSKKGKTPAIEENPPGKTAIPASPSLRNIPSPPPTNSLPTRRHPCYGWIESDEEDFDDFISLRPASAEVRAKATHLPQAPSMCPSDATKSERKRRSRWDERP